ncbi:reticulon-like protein B9 [Cynara cardunculus var. scolymus]|uniref:reticulon-like protein B9 n=1 Tax=Cynara cardunculus var. scolymus TaxID=59895 RepID=UPI000D627D25|nr:reticulon-like protein B9 [Cynara cardunculus var. scolymus]
MSISHSSDSDDSIRENVATVKRYLHSTIGKGQVADVLLWRNTRLSASLLLGFTAMWFLFEVYEYNLISLLCHIAILAMLILYITYTIAKFTQWDLPDFEELTIQESAFKWLYKKTNSLLLKFYYTSSGEDLTQFFLTMTSLWMISVIGSYFSSLNLIYLCLICIGTLPALYERYEHEVDYLASKGIRDMKNTLKQFEFNVLSKIPREQVNGNKWK